MTLWQLVPGSTEGRKEGRKNGWQAGGGAWKDGRLFSHVACSSLLLLTVLLPHALPGQYASAVRVVAGCEGQAGLIMQGRGREMMHMWWCCAGSNIAKLKLGAVTVKHMTLIYCYLL